MKRDAIVIQEANKPPKPSSWTETSRELNLPIVRHGAAIWYVRAYKSKKTKKDYDRFYYGGHWHSILELWWWVKWESTGYPMPTPEHRFDSVRKWKFDFAWLESKVAVEMEGGVHSKGRHTRGIGYKNDIEKYNSATAQGWQVYRFADMKKKHIDFMKAVFSKLNEDAA